MISERGWGGLVFSLGQLPWGRAPSHNQPKSKTHRPPSTHPSNKAEGALFDWMCCWLAAEHWAPWGGLHFASGRERVRHCSIQLISLISLLNCLLSSFSSIPLFLSASLIHGVVFVLARFLCCGALAGLQPITHNKLTTPPLHFINNAAAAPLFFSIDSISF